MVQARMGALSERIQAMLQAGLNKAQPLVTQTKPRKAKSATGYNIEWLLRMIRKKCIRLFRCASSQWDWSHARELKMKQRTSSLGLPNVYQTGIRLKKSNYSGTTDYSGPSRECMCI